MRKPRRVRTSKCRESSESRRDDWIDNEVMGCKFQDVRHGKRMRHALASGAAFRERGSDNAPGISGLGEHESVVSLFRQRSDQRGKLSWPVISPPEPVAENGHRPSLVTPWRIEGIEPGCSIIGVFGLSLLSGSGSTTNSASTSQLTVGGQVGISAANRHFVADGEVNLQRHITQARPSAEEGLAATRNGGCHLEPQSIPIHNTDGIYNLPVCNTHWRLSNAISWITGQTKDAERKLELMKIAGEVLPKAA